MKVRNCQVYGLERFVWAKMPTFRHRALGVLKEIRARARETKGNWLNARVVREIRDRVKQWYRDRQIIRFVLKHWPPAKQWRRTILKSWLRWHRGHAFLSLALNDDESIAGLVIARPVMKPPERNAWYDYDDEGSCLYVDLAISAKADALKAAGFAVLERFGMRKTVAWRRLASSNALTVYPATAIRKHLFRYLLGERRQSSAQP